VDGISPFSIARLYKRAYSPTTLELEIDHHEIKLNILSKMEYAV